MKLAHGFCERDMVTIFLITGTYCIGKWTWETSHLPCWMPTWNATHGVRKLLFLLQNCRFGAFHLGLSKNRGVPRCTPIYGHLMWGTWGLQPSFFSGQALGGWRETSVPWLDGAEISLICWPHFVLSSALIFASWLWFFRVRFDANSYCLDFSLGRAGTVFGSTRYPICLNFPGPLRRVFVGIDSARRNFEKRQAVRVLWPNKTHFFGVQRWGSAKNWDLNNQNWGLAKKMKMD